MRMLLLLAILLSENILLNMPINSFAHGSDHHGGHMDEQMKKLHAMMPMFSIASAELESAIEKGDAAGAKAQAYRILTAVPVLKKSKPHRLNNQITVFKAIAGKIEDDANKIIALAEKGNFVEAQRAFRVMETHCAECHAKFRD
jgi:soluble cytochrome b562